MFKSKPQYKINKTDKILKGDTVCVISGKDKGKRGKVLKMIKRKGRALVENINFIKKHVQKSQQHQQGGILKKEGPIEITNLLVVCNKCDKPTRVGFKILEDGRKIRVCKKCTEDMG